MEPRRGDRRPFPHGDRTVLFGFGLASALGGLLGALLHTRVSNRALLLVFG